MGGVRDAGAPIPGRLAGFQQSGAGVRGSPRMGHIGASRVGSRTAEAATRTVALRLLQVRADG